MNIVGTTTRQRDDMVSMADLAEFGKAIIASVLLVCTLLLKILSGVGATRIFSSSAIITAIRFPFRSMRLMVPMPIFWPGLVVTTSTTTGLATPIQSIQHAFSGLKIFEGSRFVDATFDAFFQCPFRWANSYSVLTGNFAPFALTSLTFIVNTCLHALVDIEVFSSRREKQFADNALFLRYTVHGKGHSLSSQGMYQHHSGNTIFGELIIP